ncbi:MAG: cyclic nucleotide-binding domain-containing protein [Desulfobacterales bacterium]|jgi:CRP-like cAMP-binding protein
MLDKNLLTKFNFFSDVSDDRLSAIAQLANLLDFKAGETIFRIGDSSDNLYGVVTGEVELILVYKDKLLEADITFEEQNQSRIEVVEKPIRVALVDPGKIFGWSSLVRGRKRTVTAICRETSQVISLPSTALESLFEKDSGLGYLLMSRLCDIISDRLQNRTEQLLEAWVEAFDVDSF